MHVYTQLPSSNRYVLEPREFPAPAPDMYVYMYTCVCILPSQGPSNQIVEEAKDQARAEGERLITAANAEIEQQANRAKEALREQVATIAIAGAEKILQRSIDQAANEELLKGLAAEL